MAQMFNGGFKFTPAPKVVSTPIGVKAPVKPTVAASPAPKRPAPFNITK